MSPRSDWLLATVVLLGGCQQTVMLENAGPEGGAAIDTGQTDAAPAPDRANPGNSPGLPGDARDDRPVAAPCSARPHFLEFRHNHPDVVISLDRSSSTSSPFGDGTRLSVAQQALRDVVRTFQGAVRFAYQEFPVNDTTCTGPAGCCAGGVSFPVLNNSEQIDRKMNECDVRGTCAMVPQTPTAEALSRCRAALDPGTSTSDRFILLVTDGEPSCGRGRNGMSACEDAIFEIGNLNNVSNVKTVVVGVGDEVARSECLDDMAVAGGMPRPETQRYYAGREPAMLRQYIGEAVRTIARRSCRIDVLSPTDASETVTLLFDNQKIDRDRTEKNGWNFGGNTTVQIDVFGGPCEQLQFGRVKEIKLLAECS